MGEGEKIKKSDQETYRRTEVGRWRYIYILYIGLLEMTQLTRKLPIALRLILRGSPGPTA